MEIKVKRYIMALNCVGLLVALSGCHDMQRWQYEEYQPYMVGDIWAPRPDWRRAEEKARTDWQAALHEMGVSGCHQQTCRESAGCCVGEAQTQEDR